MWAFVGVWLPQNGAFVPPTLSFEPPATPGAQAHLPLLGSRQLAAATAMPARRDRDLIVGDKTRRRRGCSNSSAISAIRAAVQSRHQRRGRMETFRAALAVLLLGACTAA